MIEGTSYGMVSCFSSFLWTESPHEASDNELADLNGSGLSTTQFSMPADLEEDVTRS